MILKSLGKSTGNNDFRFTIKMSKKELLKKLEQIFKAQYSAMNQQMMNHQMKECTKSADQQLRQLAQMLMHQISIRVQVTIHIQMVGLIRVD